MEHGAVVLLLLLLLSTRTILQTNGVEKWSKLSDFLNERILKLSSQSCIYAVYVREEGFACGGYGKE